MDYSRRPPPGSNWNVFFFKRRVTITAGFAGFLQQWVLGNNLIVIRKGDSAAWEKVMQRDTTLFEYMFPTVLLWDLILKLEEVSFSLLHQLRWPLLYCFAVMSFSASPLCSLDVTCYIIKVCNVPAVGDSENESTSKMSIWYNQWRGFEMLGTAATRRGKGWCLLPVLWYLLQWTDPIIYTAHDLWVSWNDYAPLCCFFFLYAWYDLQFNMFNYLR